MPAGAQLRCRWSMAPVPSDQLELDSPWPLSNNLFAKYNDRALLACNAKLPLWQLVRASTAAPTYFPPEVMTYFPLEVIMCGNQPFIFVDRGVTMYNNPTFQMFLMATVDRYWIKAPRKIAAGKRARIKC